jgi:hypothetical protein
MILVYMLLSFGLVIGISALFWKLAARILRYGGVTWPLALLAAATIVFIMGFVRGVFRALGFSAPLIVGMALGLLIAMTIGAWCFRDRATHPDGQPVDWSGAFKLSGVAIGLNALTALLLFIAVGLLLES